MNSGEALDRPASVLIDEVEGRGNARLCNTVGRIASAASARAGADEGQALGFTPRDFVIFGLPFKNPGTSLLVRKNGAVTFTITSGVRGLPHGQDRLLVIWLATVFKLCGSPASNAIAFDSLRSIARVLGKTSAGHQLRRIEEGLIRLFDATFLSADVRPSSARRDRYQLMRRLRLWREAGPAHPNQHALSPNVIVLDPTFANDVRTDAIPVDLESVVALGENMGPLSLYQFEAYSSYVLARRGKSERAIPVLGPAGLLAQLGSGIRASDTRKARATIRNWQAIVQRLWPDCPNELVRDGTVLIVRAGYAMKHGRLSSPAAFGVRPSEGEDLKPLDGATGESIVERERESTEDEEPKPQ